MRISIRRAAFVLVYTVLSIASLQTQEGKVESHNVWSPALAGNMLGDDPARSVLVYIPPGYSASSQRYPVVYLLHAYGTHPTSWLGGEDGYEDLNITLALDSLIAIKTIQPMIVVMPDAYNKFGGSWYVNSTTAGRWEDFIADDLVAYIDSSYRTIAHRSARGITGQSMGAYGAFSIAMHRPDVFSAVLAMSPPNVTSYNPFGDAALENALEYQQDDTTGGILSRLTWSRAIAFAPNPNGPPFFADLPVRYESGRLIRVDSVEMQWANSLLANSIMQYRENLQQLVIAIEIGDRDGLRRQLPKFLDGLDNMKIQYLYSVFPGDHTLGVRKQFEKSVFQFFSNHVEGE